MKLPNNVVLCALILNLGAAPQAMANTIAIAAPAEAPAPKRIEIDLAMQTGGIHMGTTRADATGLVVNAGLRIGELSLLAEGGHFRLRADERGTLSRVGLTTRYSLVPIGGDFDVATSDLWLEAGVGYERVRWRSGGVLERPDLAMGFGWQANIVLDRHSQHPRYLGPFFALRSYVAESPASKEPATCGGPCDRATPPSRVDVSLLFQFGLNWGRKSF